MRLSIMGSAALIWLTLSSCADVPRSNKFDINAPLAQQALGLVDVTVEATAADPNAPSTPVTNAHVKLTGPRTDKGVTDDSGNAIINDLTPGDYNILVSAAGYYDNVGTVTVLPGQEASVEISLHAAPQNGNLAAMGTIVGVAIKSDQLGLTSPDNSGITAMTVDSGQTSVATTTDANGEFTLQVMPGPHDVQFSAPGYTSVTFTNVYVSAGSATAPCAGAVVLQQQN